jgi:RNA polymerase sigma factor (TIGR02999 family)
MGLTEEHFGDAESPHEITDALLALRSGAPDAADRLMTRVYGELRAMAHRQLGAERPGHTLRTTDLVHEAYFKLVDQARASWTDRAQFFAVAARVMRRILVDYARRHRALRRGGGRERVSLEDIGGALTASQPADELLSLDEALDRLEAVDERLSRVVECRFFGGLTEAETAEALGVNARTVTRDWVRARAWLYRELSSDPT